MLMLGTPKGRSKVYERESPAYEEYTELTIIFGTQFSSNFFNKGNKLQR